MHAVEIARKVRMVLNAFSVFFILVLFRHLAKKERVLFLDVIQAVRDGAAAVVAVGGDGTLHEVLLKNAILFQCDIFFIVI